MPNILIVAESKNFIVSSLIQHIESDEKKVLYSDARLNEIEKVKDEIDVLFIFAEESLVDRIEVLVYLKDKVIEQNIPILLLGADDDMDKIQAIIPKQYIKNRFLRPVNVKEVSCAIDEYMEKNKDVQKKLILVVDDSGAVLRNVKAWLEDKYRVVLANSGAMAIKYLAMNKPDLILLDYEMPICDGKQVLEMIRSEQDFAKIPVIFLTNKNDKESVLGVTSLKPEGYLLKTMEPSQIVKSIDDYFEKDKWKL